MSAYVSNRLYTCFLLLSLFLLLPLSIQFSKNQAAYFHNYSTKDQFLLEHQLTRNTGWVTLTQSDSGATPPLHPFASAWITQWVLNSLPCALTLDLRFRSRLASPLMTVGLCPPTSFQPCPSLFHLSTHPALWSHCHLLTAPPSHLPPTYMHPHLDKPCLQHWSNKTERNLEKQPAAKLLLLCVLIKDHPKRI